nr:beta-galactosidase [Candidatus Sigynarchaeum springense]
MRGLVKLAYIVAVAFAIGSSALTIWMPGNGSPIPSKAVMNSVYLGGPYPIMPDTGFGAAHMEMINPDQWFTGMAEHYNDSLLHKSALMEREAGISWNRFEFAWSTIQPTPTTWDWSDLDAYMNWSDNYGLKILPVIAYGNWWACKDGDYLQKIENMSAWRTYVHEVVTRYKDRPSFGGWWELWNEPNIYPFFHGDFIEDFVPAMVVAAQEIRSIDPNQKILTCSLTSDMAPDFAAMVDAIGKENFTSLFDGVAIHPYADTPEEVAQKILDCQEVFEGWYDGEMWITEVGWPVNPAVKGTVADYNKAQNIAKTLALAKGLGITHTIIHMWCDWGDIIAGKKVQNQTYGEHWFGIVDLYANPKPSYFSFKTVANLIGQATNLGGLRVEGVNVGHEIYAYAFGQADGTAVIPLWTPSSTKVRVGLSFPGMANYTIIDAYNSVVESGTAKSVHTTISDKLTIIIMASRSGQQVSLDDFTLTCDFDANAVMAFIAIPGLVIVTATFTAKGLKEKKRNNMA